MTQPRLIGLYSSAPGSGKTTVAKILQDHNYRILSFATPLKRMTIAFLMGFGYTQNHAKRMIENKDYVVGEINMRIRDIMQTIGTEWGRNMIHQDVWIRMWEADQKKFPFIVVDDMRFPNEYKAVKRRGGLMIRIDRASAIQASKEVHSSEGALDTFEFDHVIDNNGGLIDLAEQVITIVNANRKGFY